MFKALIEQKELMEGLRSVRGTVGKKGLAVNGTNTESDIHMEVLMDATSGALYLKLVTNNGSEITECKANILGGDVGVSALLEFDKFANIIQTIDEATTIQLESDEGRLSLNYHGRKKPIMFNGSDPVRFQQIPKLPVQDTIVLPMDVLKDGVEMASLIIKDKATQPLFNCVSVKAENNVVEFSALDTTHNRMLHYSRAIPTPAQGSFFVESNKLKKMLSGFDTGKDVTINVTESNITLEQEDATLMIRLINGSFPDVTQFMKTSYIIEAELKKSELITALDRAKVLSDMNTAMGKSVTLHVDATSVTIDLSSQFGSLYEAVPCTLKGKPTQMTFFFESLYEAVKAVKGEDLTLAFYSASNVVLIPSNPVNYTQKLLVQAIRSTAPKPVGQNTVGQGADDNDTVAD